MSGSGSAVPPREPMVVLREAVGHLAYLATERHYAEQPDLWASHGERGRALTMEDYTHHLRHLVPLREDLWVAHLRYCEELFASRGFPHRWLTDAFRILGDVLAVELPAEVSEPALAILRGEHTPRA
jgi:hypothetical protein